MGWRVPDVRIEALKRLGQWHCFEDWGGVARAVKNVL